MRSSSSRLIDFVETGAGQVTNNSLHETEIMLFIGKNPGKRKINNDLQSLHDARARLKISAIDSMARKRNARVNVHFLRRVQ